MNKSQKSKRATSSVERMVSLRTWLEWSLGRLEHLLKIHDEPKSVSGMFGVGETMHELRHRLPQLRERLKQANDQAQ